MKKDAMKKEVDTMSDKNCNDSGPPKPALALNFLSHGTFECRDVAKTRQFFEEFLGLEVIQTSHISLLIRLGGRHCYAVVESKDKAPMLFLYHNGLDVENEAAVDAAYEIVRAAAERWNLSRITKPAVQHGTYSFYFWDLDENCWEILCNPEDGYSWLFDKGDQKGRGHLSKDFDRPTMIDE